MHSAHLLELEYSNIYTYCINICIYQYSRVLYIHTYTHIGVTSIIHTNIHTYLGITSISVVRFKSTYHIPAVLYLNPSGFSFISFELINLQTNLSSVR